MKNEVALITGASRGLGRGLALELGKLGYFVIVTARKESDAKLVANKIKEAGGKSDFFQLDLIDRSGIENTSAEIIRRYEQLDILINNAGVFDSAPNSILTISSESIFESLKVNALAPVLLTQALLPLLQKSSNARIINMSSEMGSLKNGGGGYPAYRFSKTLLNAITLQLHYELQSKGIRCNSVCPGWVKTDMGGASAPRTIDQGVAGILKTIQTANDGPSGKFFRDGSLLEW